MDAARQTIADLCQRPFQLPAHGGGIPQRALRAGASSLSTQASRDGFELPRERVSWSRSVAEKWPRVRIVDCSVGEQPAVLTGSRGAVAGHGGSGGSGSRRRAGRSGGRAGGRRGRIGRYAGTDAQSPGRNNRERQYLFGRDFVPLATGRLGYSARMSPNHFDDPLSRPCNALLKWAGES